jgi:hypothetical protein
VALSATKVQVHDVAADRLLGVLLFLRDKDHLALSPDGHWRGSPDIESPLVYVAVTENGQETLT